MAAQDKPESTLKEEGPQPVVVKPEPERDLVSWVAPARPFKRRDRKFYVTTIAIAAIVGLVLFLVDGFLPVILVISVVFLFYVLSTVEPENIQYKITTKGVKIVDKTTPWGIMRRFWLTRRFDSDILVIETFALPGRLELVIRPEIKEELTKKVSDYLAHEEASPSFLDKSANWFAQRLSS